MDSSKNRYYRRSRISERLFRRLTKAFAMDLTATNAAELTGLSVRSTNAIYLKLRRRIAERCEARSPFAGEVEIDESCFGPRRVKGKRGRGAGSKTIVFGVFKRDGRVYTEIVPDVTKNILRKAIRGRVSLDTVIHSDGWRGYDGPVDVGYAKHLRVNHGEDEFVDGRSHIGIPGAASRASGPSPSTGGSSSRACRVTRSICISRRPSSASTAAVIASTACCSNSFEKTPSRPVGFLRPLIVINK